jgi:hypothetical protein
MLRAICVAVATACVWGPASTTDAHAQVVTGRVIEELTERPLRDVSVQLRSAAGRTMARSMTDSTGTFWLQAPRYGTFVLVAEHLGMTTVTTGELDVDEGAMQVVLRMAETAVPLEPLTVEAERGAAHLGPLRGYYERMRWNERTGIGRFITRDQIDVRSPGDLSDMLREIPRVNVQRTRGRSAHVTMRGSRGDCTPALFIDGTRANRREQAFVDEYVRPLDVEGVEVYVGLAQMPGVYHDESGCGVLLVWTRRGSSEGGRPFSWRRALAGIGVFGGLLLLMR